MNWKTLRDRRFWIGIFCVFHCLAVFICEFPRISPVREVLAVPFREYIRFFNLGQNWSMFAPEPSSINAFLRAEVRFKDGSVDYHDFPRMSKMSVSERFFKERYRKWAVDNVRTDDHRVYWPAAARYAARRAQEKTGKVPIEVSLWRHWTIIKDPMKEFVPTGYRIPDEKLEKFKFHIQVIREEDL
ncbi:MAG: hypothetical protein KGP28_07025 [Bdellovibrionales bacterium]|nr:hypothetical protein [Bdellovibrionales bacterium]